MAVAGYSINTLTLFGMVLAIGLLVDDAIVVENVERLITTEHLSPIDAARKSMDEITSADRRLRCCRRCSCRWRSSAVDRRDLSPVLDHDRLGDGAVGVRRAGAHPRTVRHHPQPHDPNKRKAMARWRASSAGSTTSSTTARRSMKRACAPRAAGSARAWSIC
jgi:hypothetical protein